VKVVLFSYHYFESTPRAGFHHLAEAYWDLGWDVIFVTAPLSRLSRLVRDPRLEYPVVQEANRRKPVRERLTSYVLYTRLHPANLRFRLLNRLTGGLLVRAYRRSSLGALETELTNADLIVFESTPAIALAPVVRKIAPNARLVYRVSDDLEILRVHPAVLRAEREALPVFDYVSSPSRHSMRKLGAFREVAYQGHAIAKHLFDAESESPYAAGPNACWVGSALLDPEFLRLAAERLPNWHFHVIGRARRAVLGENVIWHGELPYERTVAFIKHADVGLAVYGGHEGRVPGYLADSLKIVQYAYCGLPVIAPDALESARPHVFYYRPADADSIEQALRGALAAGKRPELGRAILSWEELAASLADEAGQRQRASLPAASGAGPHRGDWQPPLVD
jgi:2-beta-glucuronyltransferase